MDFIELLRLTAANNDKILRACQKINDGILELLAVLAEFAPKHGPDVFLEGLTRRQKEIFGLIAKGQGREEIAKALDLELRTVESHLDTTRRRLKLPTVADLLEFAKQHQKG